MFRVNDGHEPQRHFMGKEAFSQQVTLSHVVVLHAHAPCKLRTCLQKLPRKGAGAVTSDQTPQNVAPPLCLMPAQHGCPRPSPGA